MPEIDGRSRRAINPCRGRSSCMAEITAAIDVCEPSTFASADSQSGRQRVQCIERGGTMRPRLLDLRGDFEALAFESMASEADSMLRSAGRRHNGKWNAPVGPSVARFVDESGFVSLVRAFSDVRLGEVLGATFIAYDGVGEHLPIHLDDAGFGEANVLVCLRHGWLEGEGSATVFLTAAGVHSHVLEPGMALLFDGAATPHGRTPLSAGEEVVLVSFGFAAERRRSRVDGQWCAD